MRKQGKGTLQLLRAATHLAKNAEQAPVTISKSHGAIESLRKKIISRNAQMHVVRRIQDTKRRVKKMCSLTAPKLQRDRGRRELNIKKYSHGDAKICLFTDGAWSGQRAYTPLRVLHCTICCAFL